MRIIILSFICLLCAGCVTNNINFGGDSCGKTTKMTPGSLVKGILPAARCLI